MHEKFNAYNKFKSKGGFCKDPGWSKIVLVRFRPRAMIFLIETFKGKINGRTVVWLLVFIGLFPMHELFLFK